jgi:hypothetical protein
VKRDLDDGAQQRLVRTVLRLKLATAMLEQSGHPAIELVREGMHPMTLRKRVRQSEADSGALSELLSSQEREGIPPVGKENYVCSGGQTK